MVYWYKKFVLLFCIQCYVIFTIAQSPATMHYDVESGLPSNEVYSLKIDSKGFLWIGTSAGLVRYDGNRFFYSIIPNQEALP